MSFWASSGATDFSARLSLKVSSLHSNASGGRAGCQVTASLRLCSLNVSRWVCFNVIPVLLLGFNFMSFNFLFYVLISIIVKQFYCLCKLSVRECLINKSGNYGMPSRSPQIVFERFENLDAERLSMGLLIQSALIPGRQTPPPCYTPF